jgi:hypothetical protein
MSIDYIPISIQSNMMDQLRFEFNHLGPSLYIIVAEMLIKSDNLKLPLNDCNVGIIAEKLRLDEQKVMEILKDLTSETEIFDFELFEQNILFCPELERTIRKLQL